MTATADAETKSPSRRALLASALGAAAALGAQAIGRASPVRGANGDAVTVGNSFTGTATTNIQNNANGNIVFWGASSGDGVGVYGSSESNVGVSGSSTSDTGVYGVSVSQYGVFGVSGSHIGVYGYSNATDQPANLGWSYFNRSGVQGHSGSADPPAAKAKTGVYGHAAQDSNARGVWGETTAGIGVEGSSGSGSGVYGHSTSYVGLFGSSISDNAVYGSSSAVDRAAMHANSYGNSTGVLGFSGDASAPPAKAKTGVYGYAAQDSSARGVIGETTSGHGVHGTATSGFAGFFDGKVYTTKFHEMPEIPTPAAPAVDKARLFVRDNGSGKTQLCVRFNTGGVLVIKTQP